MNQTPQPIDRQIRVFTSSKFRDPAVPGTERDYLVTIIFPQFRKTRFNRAN